MSASERIQLNKGWFVRRTNGQEVSWLPVRQVPTEIHLDLLEVGNIAEPFTDLNELSSRWVAEEAWTYRTTFVYAAASNQRHKNVHLVFEGLDTFASVSLNGKEILKSENMFIEHRIDVSNLLQEENALEIHFDSARKRGFDLVKEHPDHRFIAHQTECCGKVHATAVGGRPPFLEYELWCGREVAVAGKMQQAKNGTGEARYQASFSITDPKLWWPRGYGKQDMYLLKVFTPAPERADEKVKMIGFRKTQLVQNADSDGTSFYFRINDLDIFCGGACWIPADSFVSRISPERYHSWIKLMADGNQIMIRIWGGGIYEADAFYEACDQYGILIWQDFMFACANYPAYPSFLKSVEEEAICQVKRLRNHPSIIIWTGNNEDYQIVERYGLEYKFEEDKEPRSWLKTNFPARYIYEYLLPKVVREELPGAIYHPSSPWGNGTSTVQKVDPTVGDIHQWNVWHGTMEPYQKLPEMGGRFVSEFGIEAYPHISTLKTFSSEPDELYPGSLTMEHHNKAISHSRRIISYVSENFNLSRAPSLEAFAHLTQIAQADAMTVAYKSWRRQWQKIGHRKCGGVLVWQLNDCWPTVSWAVVDYYLVPKPAYYAIKRELKPITVNIRRDFYDWTMKPAEPGLWHRDTSHIDPRSLFQKIVFDVWVASSELEQVEATLTINYISISTGKTIQEEFKQQIVIEPNATTEILRTVEGPIAHHGNTSIDNPVDISKLDPYVIDATLSLASDPQHIISEDISWPDPIKYIKFGNPEAHVTYQYGDHSQVKVEAKKPVKGFVFAEKPGLTFSDNGFDLIPGRSKFVQISGLEKGDKLAWMHVR